MASVISTAFVVVKPDTTEFANQLRTQLQKSINSIKLGERTIQIRAQFEKGTRDSLIASLGKKPIPVFVEPVLAPGSVAALRKQMKELGAIPVGVAGTASSGAAGATKTQQAASQTEVGTTAATATPQVKSLAEANVEAAAAADLATRAIAAEALALDELQARTGKVGPAKLESLRQDANAASNKRLAAQQAAVSTEAAREAATLEFLDKEMRIAATEAELLAAAHVKAAPSVATLTDLLAAEAVAIKALAKAQVEGATARELAPLQKAATSASGNVSSARAAEAAKIAQAEQLATAATEARVAADTASIELGKALKVQTTDVTATKALQAQATKLVALEQAAENAAEAAALPNLVKVAAGSKAVAAGYLEMAEAQNLAAIAANEQAAAITREEKLLEGLTRAQVSSAAVATAGRGKVGVAKTAAELKQAQDALKLSTAALDAIEKAELTTARQVAIEQRDKAAAMVRSTESTHAAEVATTSLARAEKLLLAAQTPTGTNARETARAGVRSAIALQTELTSLDRKFATAEGEAAVAIRARVAELRTLTATLTITKQAELESIVATEKKAVADARAAQAEATRSSQALRGVGATSASFLGLRGAVLSSSLPFLLATTAVIGFSKVVGTASSLQQNLNIFESVAGATADQMARVSENAKTLGADLALPATSANDAAEAMTELAKAGLTVNATIDASRGVLQLATAANISVGDAATITASQLNAFGLAGSEATRVADLLAGASISAQGEITDFALAFQQVATVAKQVDLSIDTTTAVLTEFAKAGLRGSDAGTSLRTLLLRLVPTSKSAAEAQRLLGVQIDRNIPIGEQFFNLIDQFTVGLAKLDPIAQQETLTKIFGQDAIRGASIAFTQGSVALRDLQDAVTQPGLAAQVTEGRVKGLSGAAAGLKSQVETLAGSLGTTLLPGLEAITTELSHVVGTATAATEILQKLGDITIKPIANALGGADAIVGIGLAAGAGLGIRKLLDRRKASAIEAAKVEVAAEATVVGAMEKRLVAQGAIDLAYLKNERSAVASSAVQVAATNRVGAAALTATAKLGKLLGGNKAIVAAIAATAAGSALESQSGDDSVASQAGSALSSVGQFAIGGAFIGGGPGAIVGAAVGVVAEAGSIAKKDIQGVRAQFDSLSPEEQQLALQSIPFIIQKLYGLKPKPSIFDPASIGTDTAGAAAAFSTATGIPGFDSSPFGPGKSLPNAGGRTIFADQLGKLFEDKKKFIVKGIAQEKVNQKLEAELALAIASASGNDAAVTAAINRLIAVDQQQIKIIEKQLAAFTLGGFVITGEARIKLQKKLIEIYNDLAAQNDALEQAVKKAAEFSIPASVTIAGINAGTTATLADDLAQKQTVAALTAKALQNALTAKKKDQAVIDDLSIKSAQANADVTTTTKQIADQNLANAQTQLQIAADAAGNLGAAENRYIAFLRKQANDASKTTAEQISAQQALTAELDKRKNALKAIVDARISLRDARSAFLLQVAETTPGLSDNARVLNQQIADDNKDIARIQKQIKDEHATGAELSKLKQEIIAEQSDILTKQQALKNLSGGGGFSLQDLFKESINQLATFGSNVSTAPRTPGQQRGDFAGTLVNTILGSKKDRQELGLSAVVTNTKDTNKILEQILFALTGGDPAKKNGVSTLGDSGLHTSRFATKFAAGKVAHK